MSETSQILTLHDIREAFPEDTPRIAHIAGVVHRAKQIEKADGQFNGKLILAALYHDIGYSERYRITGVHPVDSSIIARKHGLSEEIIKAVLYHTGSWREQLLRPDISSYYAPECLMMKTPLSRAVSYCDLHTGPHGQKFSMDERLADIRQRHSTNHHLLQVMDEYYERFQTISAEWNAILGSTLSLQKSPQHVPH